MSHRRFVLVLCFLLASRSIAATRVPLVIDEPFADRTAPWPVTTGVPFPRDALVDEQRCRLVDDTGAEQPLQSRVAATWDAQAKSIRWLTIDFIAQPGRSYALEFGDDVRRKPVASSIKLTRGGSLKISTGPLAV